MLQLDFRRPADRLTPPRLLSSLLAVVIAAAFWAIQVKSSWVFFTTLVLSSIPLWWAPSERERFWDRLAAAVTGGGLVTAVYLLYFADR